MRRKYLYSAGLLDIDILQLSLHKRNNLTGHDQLTWIFSASSFESFVSWWRQVQSKHWLYPFVRNTLIKLFHSAVQVPRKAQSQTLRAKRVSRLHQERANVFPSTTSSFLRPLLFPLKLGLQGWIVLVHSSSLPLPSFFGTYSSPLV